VEEEFMRKGNFERIFPCKENIQKYSKFFECTRYSNLLVWKHLKCEKSRLETHKKKGQKGLKTAEVSIMADKIE
jgi:hypothetical protein